MMSFSKLIVAVNFLSCAILSTTVQAACCDNDLSFSSDTLHENRFYLDIGTLSMDKSHLYVNIEGNFHPVKQVFTDEQGVYIDVRELDNSAFGVWHCPKGHPNPPWALVCLVCNKSSDNN